MPILKVLKSGETDIDSSDIWRFAMHSDYKNQKINSFLHTQLTLPAGSSWLNSDYVEVTIVNPTGNVSAFFATVEFGGYSYEVVGTANPQINLVSTDEFPVGAAFTIYPDNSVFTIQCWPTSFGETATDNTFDIYISVVEDELI